MPPRKPAVVLKHIEGIRIIMVECARVVLTLVSGHSLLENPSKSKGSRVTKVGALPGIRCLKTPYYMHQPVGVEC